MKKKYYVLIFLFFFLILFLTPLSNDDWENFLIGGIDPIGYAIKQYFNWEGRIISRIIIVLLACRKWLWNIISSLLLTYLVYIIYKIIKPKNKKTIFLLIITTFLFANPRIFTQTIMWMTGNITYLFVLPIMLLYFYYVINNKINDNYKIIIFSMLNIIMTMFNEQVAVLLVLSNAILFIYRLYKNKKVDKNILIFLISSIIGTVLMLISPGSQKRYIEYHNNFKNLTIINKILYNIPNFIKYTYIINYFSLILLLIVNYILINKHIKVKNIKLLLIIFMSFVPICGLLTGIFGINTFTNSKSKLLCIYYFLHLIITVILLKKEKNNKASFIYIVGILSNSIMLLSPVYSNRVAIYYYILSSVAFLIIIDNNLKIKKVYDKVLIIFNILLATTYIVCSISIYKQHKNHLKEINKIKDKNEYILTIDKYPKLFDYMLPMDGEINYKERFYKDIYGIDQKVKIIYKKCRWKYYIFYK